MAFFGTGSPVFIADGVSITLPTPSNRYEFTDKVSNEYIGINKNLIVVDIGYRLVLRLNFVDMSASDFEDIIAITEAVNVNLRIGALLKSIPVKVTRIEGEMENQSTNEVFLEVKAIRLFETIPNADLDYTMNRIFNGAVYMISAQGLNEV